MKTPKIPILIDRADYEIVATAARLVRKASGKARLDTETLIAFQFKQRTPAGLARDYLDCTGDIEARRRIREPRQRKRRTKLVEPKPGGRLAPLRPAASVKSRTRQSRIDGREDPLRPLHRPADLSRN